MAEPFLDLGDVGAVVHGVGGGPWRGARGCRSQAPRCQPLGVVLNSMGRDVTVLWGER